MSILEEATISTVLPMIGVFNNLVVGYGPDKRLAIKVSTRNIPIYHDPAVILIDQLKEIYIDGELDPVETANWFPKIARKVTR